jgi:hypothetical protein
MQAIVGGKHQIMSTRLPTLGRNLQLALGGGLDGGGVDARRSSIVVRVYAIFAAIRRASSRVSGFVFSVEHLAVRLISHHYLLKE